MEIDFNIYNNVCENCKKTLLREGYKVSTPIWGLISSQILELLNNHQMDYRSIGENLGYSAKYIKILQNWENHKWLWKISNKKQFEILKKLQEIRT